MSDGASPFVPQGPKTIVERPLDKGVITSIMPQGAPAGSFQELENFLVTPRGLLRTGNFMARGGSNLTVDYGPVTGVWKLWTTAGNGYVVVTDRKFMYVLGSSGLTAYYDTYSTSTLEVSSTTVTGAGTSWATDINAGDVLVLDADGSGDGPEDAIITRVNSDTELTIASAPTGTYAAGTDYIIRKAFRTNHPLDRSEIGTATTPSGIATRRIQAVAADDKLVFVDGARYPRSFDGTTFGQFGSLSIIPQSIAYFRDRLHFGHVIDGSDYYRYQMRWSDVGSGNLDTIGAASYQSLPYTEGAFLSFATMGGNLVAFYMDAVYIGTPTNSPSIPVDFDLVSTGGVGLVGMNAWTQALDGLFYVGQEDIYYISNQGFEGIGTPVLRETLAKCSRPEFIEVVSDPVNKRVIFGFPKDSPYMEYFWSFQWETRAWSRETFEPGASCFGLVRYETTLTIDDLTGTIDALSDSYSTIDEMGGDENPRASVFIGTQGTSGTLYNIYKTGDSKRGEFVTREIDLNLPDQKKQYTKFGMRIDRTFTDDVEFNVWLTHERSGGYWKPLGTLTIAGGTNEGKVNFRSVGTVARFRVEQVTATEPFVVEEFTVRVRARGREDSYV